MILNLLVTKYLPNTNNFFKVVVKKEEEFFVDLVAIHFKNPTKAISFYTQWTTDSQEFFRKLNGCIEAMKYGIGLPDGDDDDYHKLYKPWDICVIDKQRYFVKHGKCPIITERNDLKILYDHYPQRVIHFQPLKREENETTTFPWSLKDLDRVYFFSQHDDYDEDKSYFHIYCRIKGLHYVYTYYQIDEILRYFNRKYFPVAWSEAPHEYEDAWNLHYKAFYTDDPNVFVNETILKDDDGVKKTIILDLINNDDDDEEKDFKYVIKTTALLWKVWKVSFI